MVPVIVTGTWIVILLSGTLPDPGRRSFHWLLEGLLGRPEQRLHRFDGFDFVLHLFRPLHAGLGRP